MDGGDSERRSTSLPFSDHVKDGGRNILCSPLAVLLHSCDYPSILPESPRPCNRFFAQGPASPTPQHHKFELILEALSRPQGWEHGTITLLKDTSGVTVMNTGLIKKSTQVPYDGSGAWPVVAGGGPPKPAVSSLSNLSREMKEIYKLLRKPTAKGRLMV